MLAAFMPRFTAHAVVAGVKAAQSRICNYTQANPLKASVVISGLKTFVADLYVQKYYEGRTQVDWRRNGVFTFFGIAYLGAFQHYVYYVFFPRCFPGAGARAKALAIAAELLVHGPFLYFPAFYVCQECVMSGKLSLGVCRSALRRYATNVATDMPNCWKVWVPTQVVNFSMVPMHWRTPYVAGVSVVWSCILSAMRGEVKDDGTC
mmetsp:Transcript_46371/g.148071  ORF Transcript_46371/g.148071 Transcript_46371/m.148071 type:complete len:206 (-) Transcript_46371:106-723(-)